MLSTDAGANYRNIVSDYISLAAGAETGVAFIGFHSTNSTAARTGSITGRNAGLSGAPKACEIPGAGALFLFVQSMDPVNAVRVTNSTGGNLTAGSIWLMGR
ncbi:MAG: hypothetical protein EOS40_34735 [Mesorhizobium sp.]|nr:MAG: hypothetical protein EOS40_34735 [Mesorhizobium sp.]